MAHKPCFQRIYGNCIACCSFALKKLHSIPTLRQMLFKKLMVIVPLLLRETSGYKFPLDWITEQKYNYFILSPYKYFHWINCRISYLGHIFSLGEVVDPVDRSYFAYFAYFSNLLIYIKAREFKSHHPLRRLHLTFYLISSLISHGSVKIEPYLNTYLYRTL